MRWRRRRRAAAPPQTIAVGNKENMVSFIDVKSTKGLGKYVSTKM